MFGKDKSPPPQEERLSASVMKVLARKVEMKEMTKSEMKTRIKEIRSRDTWRRHMFDILHSWSLICTVAFFFGLSTR